MILHQLFLTSTNWLLRSVLNNKSQSFQRRKRWFTRMTYQMYSMRQKLLNLIFGYTATFESLAKFKRMIISLYRAK